MSDNRSPVGLHLKRPCLLVSDLERSLKIYRDILGFRLDYQSPADSDSYLYTVFALPATASLTFAAFSTPNESRALALAEVKGIDLPLPQPPYRAGLVVQVDSLDTILAQWQALELPICPPNHFTASDRRFTEQGVYDCDRHLLILYESQPVMTE